MSNLFPSISIIIPTLNTVKTLRDCLESIAVQDYPKDKLEIIIADGGSTDYTLNIFSEFSVASNLHPQPSNVSVSTSNLHPLTSSVSVSASNLQPSTSDISFPDYLFDIDLIYELLSLTNPGNSTDTNRFAKIKAGIIRIFSGDIKTFARKQHRRIKDYLYYNKLGIRKYPWKRTNEKKLAIFIFSCITLLPLLVQSLRGYIRKPDPAWFFHPLACWITFLEYGWGRIRGILGVKELKREGWGQ